MSASKKQNATLRSTAALIVCAVIKQGRSLTDALTLVEKLEPIDRSLCKQICYGTLRWYFRLDALLNLLVEKPFRAKDTDIKALALVGLYQLIYLETPAHAAVSETVESTRVLRKKWAKGLLNAVLRRFIREQEQLEATVDKQINQQYAHPKWLVKQLSDDWGDELNRILECNNQQAPMTIRVNQRHTDRETYQTQLEENEVTASPCRFNPQGLTLEHAVNVDQLPEFWQGGSSVQDGAAQLAANLLGAQENHFVLDVCAAPGGKASHILESSPDSISLTAIDIDPDRNKRIYENLERLNLKATVLTADAADPSSWPNDESSQQSFDRILLDAPCSATGVIRRHPDIKLLRKAPDITALAELQQTILQAIWPLLKQNGVLLYATCSILKAENSLQIERFLDHQADAKEITINAKWGRPCKTGRQIFPGEDNMDGFYYACLTKK